MAIDLDGLDGTLRGEESPPLTSVPRTPTPRTPLPALPTAPLPTAPEPEAITLEADYEPTLREAPTQSWGRRVESAEILALDPPSAVLTQPWSWGRFAAWVAAAGALVSLAALALSLGRRAPVAAVPKPAAIVAKAATSAAPVVTTTTATTTATTTTATSAAAATTHAAATPTPAAAPRPLDDEAIVPARFTFNGSVPRADAAVVIALARDFLSRCGGPILLTGHADARGTDRANHEIGLERAAAVHHLLVAGGLPPDRLRVASAGALAPIASNSSALGRRENRRVTLSCFNHDGGVP